MTARFRRLLLALFCVSLSARALAGAYDDLLAAVANDDTKAVIALIERGMDVNTVDHNGTTLLMLAARSGNRELLDYLVQHHANLALRNKFGDSALLLAAFKGDPAIVGELVDAGAELNPASGWTPLIYAAFQGKTEAAKLLLGRGAHVDAQAPNGLTALMVAAREGYLETVRLLLDKGADARLKDQGGQTAVDIAVRHGNTVIADFIRAHESRRGGS